MKILVTGGTGYVGKEVVAHLLKKHKIVVLSRKKRVADYETRQGNIADYNDVKNAVRGCDAVIHLAVESRHSASREQHHRTTVLGTENVIRASIEEGVKIIVNMSSSAVLSTTETNYTWAKKRAEEVVKKYQNKITIVSLRPSSIYDLERILQTKRAARFPLPKLKTRFRPIFRTTLVECIEKALKKKKSKIYGVGDKQPISLVNFIKAAAAPKKPFFFPAFLIKPAGLFPRFKFLVEDKVFKTDMKELGVKPQDTLEVIRREKQKAG
ncbi:MAG: NAD(P)-dependent oxidoreductase [Candidatus Altiarchaeota archaeon]|nr:NAD(P)-dependent oxidoreductase [Candidatus Altiarchaeota archaeon]